MTRNLTFDESVFKANAKRNYRVIVTYENIECFTKTYVYDTGQDIAVTLMTAYSYINLDDVISVRISKA